MLLGHGMLGCKEIVILDLFNGQPMLLIRLLCLQRKQLLSAAAYAALRHAGDDVAAIRANVEIRFLHASSLGVLFIQAARKQAGQVNAQQM